MEIVKDYWFLIVAGASGLIGYATLWEKVRKLEKYVGELYKLVNALNGSHEKQIEINRNLIGSTDKMSDKIDRLLELVLKGNR